jgi:hypothetical protein
VIFVRKKKSIKEQHLEEAIRKQEDSFRDIRVIRELMRKGASSRVNLYMPRETKWSRFATRSEESQKSA